MFVIEEARPEDLDGVIRLASATFPEHYEESFFFSVRELSGETFLVARDFATDTLAGFLLAVRTTQVEARVLLLAVRPGQRGSGVGSRLLREVEGRLRRKGVLGMTLEVREDNVAAIRFYRRHAYEIRHAVPAFYQDGSKAVVMEKGL